MILKNYLDKSKDEDASPQEVDINMKFNLKENPFPFLFIRDLISKTDLNNLNKILPNYCINISF